MTLQLAVSAMKKVVKECEGHSENIVGELVP